jgi:hypothetical protein
MNKDGVLDEYISRGSGNAHTGPEAAAAEEAAMIEMASRFEPFDFDVLASRSSAIAQ